MSNSGEFMNVVEPIKDLEKLEAFKEVLRSNPRDYLLALLGLNTGLRISDIVKLKVCDVKDKTHIELNEEKTGKHKKFLINDTLKSALKGFCENMDGDEYLFQSRQGNSHIKRFRAYQILNSAAKEVGIEDRIGCHTLRKSFGYHFYQSTKDIALLMELFNHASQRVTLRYIGLSQEAKDQAIREFSL